MFMDGRWFWWVVAGCAVTLFADVTKLGPFAEAADRREVEVLGDSVERDPVMMSTTSTTVPSTTSVTLSDTEALEELQGLDQETLDALEDIKGVDPADLTTTTTR